MTVRVSINTLAVLGKEHSLPVLEVLFINGWSTASEVARELNVHITTAQVHLEGLHAQGILEARNRRGHKKRIEYALVDPSIIVRIDIDAMVTQKANAALERAKHMSIKENANAHVSYGWNESERCIEVINIMEHSKRFGRTSVAESIRLTEVEGKFLWYLPQATEDPKSLVEIANEAGLNDRFLFIRILALVEMLAFQNLIILEDHDEKWVK